MGVKFFSVSFIFPSSLIVFTTKNFGLVIHFERIFRFFVEEEKTFLQKTKTYVTYDDEIRCGSFTRVVLKFSFLS